MSIPQTHTVMLYKLLKDVAFILKKHNIEYFIDGGTLLGATRNNVIIPHDDDIDIGMNPSDFNKMLKVQKDFIDVGYSIQNDDSILKVFVPNQWTEHNGKIIGTPTLDIFRYSLHGQYYCLYHLSLRKRWPFSKHRKTDLYPLKMVKFGELTVPAPNNPIPYLDGTYPDWRTKIVIDLRDIENPLQKYND